MDESIKTWLVNEPPKVNHLQVINNFNLICANPDNVDSGYFKITDWIVGEHIEFSRQSGDLAKSAFFVLKYGIVGCLSIPVFFAIMFFFLLLKNFSWGILGLPVFVAILYGAFFLVKKLNKSSLEKKGTAIFDFRRKVFVYVSIGKEKREITIPFEKVKQIELRSWTYPPYDGGNYSKFSRNRLDYQNELVVILDDSNMREIKLKASPALEQKDVFKSQLLPLAEELSYRCSVKLIERDIVKENVYSISMA